MLVKSSMIRGDHTRDGETSAKRVALFLTAYCVSTEAQFSNVVTCMCHQKERTAVAVVMDMTPKVEKKKSGAVPSGGISSYHSFSLISASGCGRS